MTNPVKSLSLADETVLLRLEAKLLAKRADIVERRGGKVVEISPSMARRISEQLQELEQLRGRVRDAG